MIDEKKLKEIKSSDRLAIIDFEDMNEIIRLARLGLWAEKHCLKTILKELKHTVVLADEALAALPKESEENNK